MPYSSSGYNGTKCDYVTEQLKDMIIAGVYKAGEKLPNEASLCEQFGVSRITVREAMKKLSMMGLLDIRQGKGTFVKPVDLGLFMKPLYQMIDFGGVNVETIFDARERIEGGIAGLAALRRTTEDVLRLEQILSDLKKAIAQEMLNDVAHFDSMFHMEVARCADNAILFACVKALDDINKTCVVRLSKTMAMLEDCYEEHFRIYEAIKLQDAAKAELAMREHAVNSKVLLMD